MSIKIMKHGYGSGLPFNVSYHIFTNTSLKASLIVGLDADIYGDGSRSQ